MLWCGNEVVVVEDEEDWLLRGLQKMVMLLISGHVPWLSVAGASKKKKKKKSAVWYCLGSGV